MIATPGLNINFLKKEPYSGSHIGLRYYFCKSEEGLLAYTYPEPYCFEATPDEQKKRESFEFSEDGLKAAIAWVNEQI